MTEPTNDKARAEHRGSVGYVYRVALVAAVGGLLFGYDTAVIAGAIDHLEVRFNLTELATGWAAASALLGCIGGAAFVGMLSDWLGRKKVLLLAAIFFAISAIGSAIPQSLAAFAAARILGGFGVGAASMLSPLYIAEIAPARIRGRLVSVNQLTIVCGMLVVYFVNAVIASYGDSAWKVETGWRWMFGSETLPACCFFLLLSLVPESPRWLAKQGRGEEALRILTRVGGREQAEQQLAEIQDAIAREEGSLAELFRPGIRIALLIAVILAILQQITGINVVLYYAPTIFKSAGLPDHVAMHHTVFVGAVMVAFTVVAMWLVDRGGRKPLLLIASAGMAIFMFLLGRAFVYEQFEGAQVLIYTVSYVAFFSVAMGPVVWVVLSEIFPTRIRGRAMAIATVHLWTANFLVTWYFPAARKAFPGAVFFFLGGMCVIAFLFVALFIPETKGKTLEEIEKRWTAG